jgi:hypothetical protein
MAGFTYYSDLRSVQLDEHNRSWIQAMRVGEYVHPRHGKLQFTAERLHRFAENIKNRVRGVDLDIDYDHKADPSKGNEAAGWVKDSKVEGGALWVLVEWTQSAAQKIKERAYRYFSPEFQDSWKDALGQTHQDVLFGGGITNRPFLKDLLPLNLSELSFNEPKKESSMDPKKVREMLGLPEDATDQKVEERAAELRKAETSRGTPTQEEPKSGPNEPAKTSHGNNDALNAQERKDNPFDDKDDKQLSELFEKNPFLKKLSETVAEQSATIKKLTEANQRSEIRRQLSDLNVAGSNAKLTPAAIQLAEDVQMGDSSKLTDLLKLVAENKATVTLGETTGAGYRSSLSEEGGKDLDAIIEGRVTKMLTEANATGGKMTRPDALEEVFKADHALFAAYQDASYGFKI